MMPEVESKHKKLRDRDKMTQKAEAETKKSRKKTFAAILMMVMSSVNSRSMGYLSAMITKDRIPFDKRAMVVTILCTFLASS